MRRITWIEEDAKNERQENVSSGYVGDAKLFTIAYYPASGKWYIEGVLGDAHTYEPFATREGARTKCERVLTSFVKTLGAEFTQWRVTWVKVKKLPYAWDGYLGNDTVFTIRPISQGGGVYLTVLKKGFGRSMYCGTVTDAKRAVAERLGDKLPDDEDKEEN